MAYAGVPASVTDTGCHRSPPGSRPPTRSRAGSAGWAVFAVIALLAVGNVGTGAAPLARVDGLAASQPAAHSGLIGGTAGAAAPGAGGQYYVNLTETGLPTSTLWSALLDARVTYSPSEEVVIAHVANGSYQLAVSEIPGYTVTPSNMILVVNGSDVNVSVTFTAYPGSSYTLEIEQFGFVSPTSWTEVTSGLGYSQGTNRSLELAVPVGNYSVYPAPEAGYTGTGPSNSTLFQVTSAGGTVAIYFYDLTVIESGLPNGTVWSTDFEWTQNGILTGGGVTGPYPVQGVSVPNGSVDWDVEPVTGYNLSVSSGNVTVDGAPIVLSVEFIPPLYPVTFTAVGLAPYLRWGVQAGGLANNSTSDQLVLNLRNGTYVYQVESPPNFIAANSTGTFAVNGTGVLVSVAFVPAYTVAFSESGLAAGDNWTVTIDGRSNESMNESELFWLPNGTFAFQVTGPAEFGVTPSNGSLTVDGAAVAEAITFFPPTYAVDFDESGLRPSAEWGVTLVDGSLGPVTHMSTSSNVSFLLVNGSYAYTVDPVSGFTVSPTNGSVEVDGGASPVAIAFRVVPATYLITFVISGGTGWSVRVDNENLSPAGEANSVSIALTNGSYNFSVYAPSPYTATPSGGQILVNGSAQEVSIALQQINTGPPPSKATPGNSALIYGVIAAGVLALVVALLLLVRRRRRGAEPRPPEPPGPKAG